MPKELLTRQFRKQPFSWQEKVVLRLLKRKYNKRTLPYRRSVYLALTEIESDFGTDFIKNYTKTIATYAGIERHLASKILKEFERLELIKIDIIRDEKGRFFGKKVWITECPLAEKPPVVKPPVVTMPHKKVVYSKKVDIYKKDLKKLKRLNDLKADFVRKTEIKVK